MKTNSYKKIITAAIGMLTLFGIILLSNQVFAAGYITTVKFSEIQIVPKSTSSAELSATITYVNPDKGTTSVSGESIDFQIININNPNASKVVFEKNFSETGLDIKYNTPQKISLTVNNLVTTTAYMASIKESDFATVQSKNFSLKDYNKTSVVFGEIIAEQISADSAKVSLPITVNNILKPSSELVQDAKLTIIVLRSDTGGEVKRDTFSLTATKYNTRTTISYTVSDLKAGSYNVFFVEPNISNTRTDTKSFQISKTFVGPWGTNPFDSVAFNKGSVAVSPGTLTDTKVSIYGEVVFKNSYATNSFTPNGVNLKGRIFSGLNVVCEKQFQSQFLYNKTIPLTFECTGLKPNTKYSIVFWEQVKNITSETIYFTTLTIPSTNPAPIPALGGSNPGATPPPPTQTTPTTNISFANNNLTSTSADGKIDTTISMNSITVKGTKVDVVGKITYGKRDETEPLPQLDAGKLTLELLAPVTPPLTSNTVLATKTIDVVPAPAKLNFDAPYKSYQFTASFDSVQNTASIKSLRITETDLRSPSTNFALTTTSSGVLIPPGSETPEDSETSSEPKKADRPLLSNPLRSDLTTIPGIVNAIVSGIVIPVAIPLLALAIMYTGFLFVIAKGNPEKLKTAKEALKWTVYGGLIILGSYIIAEALQGTLKDILGQ